MKYKKRSSQKKKQRQRYRFSKKYVQRGGEFMETIAELIAMEGRTNTCMAVHPTQPLVVVGDDAGTVTLWDLGQATPKKLAQLIGLPTAVKCVEFHKTLPLVAAACNDRVLMWRFDQIIREQQDQQVQPHMVSDFRARNETEVQEELSETKIILKEAEEERHTISHDQVTIENNVRDIQKKITAINEDRRVFYLEERVDRIKTMLKETEKLKKKEKASFGHMTVLAPSFLSESARRRELDLRKDGEEFEKQLEPLRQELKELQAQKKTMTERFNELETRLKSITTLALDKETKIRKLDRELKMIRAGARDEVSCIAFYPGFYPGNYSYIAVSVNNNIHNRIIMYRFIEPSSLVVEYTMSRDSFHRGPLDDVLMVSFSHDGKLFAFVTKSSDGITVLKVRNFKGPETRYYETEYESYRIDAEKKRAITSIRPCSSNVGVFSWGTEHKHNFLIGCDDGYLTMIQANTQTSKNYGAVTTIRDLKSIREWNAGEPIKCVAVHPILPLFASGSRSAAKLWDTNKPDALQSLALQDVISVGFNQQFLAVCGSGSMHFYKERKERLVKVHNQLREKTLGQCAICFEPMIDPLIESAIRFGPEEEGYLPCTHKFHRKCIQPWLNKEKTCPACRALVPPSGLTLSTPPKVLADRSKNIEEMNKKWKEFNAYVEKKKAQRALNFSTDVQGSPPLAQGSPVRYIQGIRSEQQPSPQSSERPLTLEELRAARLAYFEGQREKQQEPSENSGGGSKNKYSRRKNRSKKSKISRRYSKKNKNTN